MSNGVEMDLTVDLHESRLDLPSVKISLKPGLVAVSAINMSDLESLAVLLMEVGQAIHKRVEVGERAAEHEAPKPKRFNPQPTTGERR